MTTTNSKFNKDLPLNIRIKVNEENNVIFLKCSGFETEIFMPTIIGGRLSIINIVPQRRCKCILTTHIVSKANSNKLQKLMSEESSKKFSFSTASNKQFYTSTPERRNTSDSVERENLETHIYSLSEEELRTIQARNRSLEINDIAIIDNHKNSNLTQEDLQSNNSPLQQLPSPEPLRRFVAANNKSFTILQNENQKNYTQYRVTEESANDLTNAVRTSTASANTSPAVALNLPLGDLSSMEYPRTPSPVNTTLEMLIASPASLKWRKVLTPVRTYSRRKYSPCKSISSTSASTSGCSTQGIKAQQNIVAIKRRKKYKFDEKLNISPKSFKQQLQCEPEIDYRELQHEEFLKRRFDRTKKTAFDLFTTPTMRSKCFALALVQMYQKRCIHKGSSTYPKYKKLARIVCPTAIQAVEPSVPLSSGCTLISIDHC